MGVFRLFGKKETEASAKTIKTTEWGEFDIYSGMRVEVTTETGQILFAAKLLGLHGNKGELHQYLESDMAQEMEQNTEQDVEPIRANIRGYSDRERKAVHMEGVIAPGPNHIWKVEELTLNKIENDRAFFRLEANVDATVTVFAGLEMGEKPCRLLNVSIGGASIESERRYYKGDKFLLKFKLLEERQMFATYCQVVRAIEKENGKFEYGCCFVELTDMEQAAIAQDIFAVQSRKRATRR